MHISFELRNNWLLSKVIRELTTNGKTRNLTIISKFVILIVLVSLYKGCSKTLAMATGACCGVAPLLFRKKSFAFEGKHVLESNKTANVSKNHKGVKGFKLHSSCSVADNFVTMTELKNKIMSFRDLLDLSPCVGSASINELVIGTVKDLHQLYPEIIPSVSMSEVEGTPIHQALASFCVAMRSIGDMWSNNTEWMEKCRSDTFDTMLNNNVEQLALAILDDMIKVARERMFDMMDEDEQSKDYSPNANNMFGRALSDSFTDIKTPFSCSPATPTSVLPDMISRCTKGEESAKNSYTSPLLMPLRVQAVGKLNPIDVKRLSFHMFPHVVAHDFNVLTQVNKTSEELEREKEAKNDSEVQENVPEILMSDAEKVRSDKGRNWMGNLSIPRARSLDILSSLDMNVLVPAPSLPKLFVPAEARTPIRPISPPLPPNDVASQPPVVSLPQPPLPPNVAVSKPPVSAPLPPLPPPLPMASSNTSVLPPPPPPPPMTSGNIVRAPPPPPPPVTSGNVARPPPPPPPPLTSGNTAMPPPPPPPMMPSNGSAPPPPPMALGKGGGPPPPPAFGGGRSLLGPKKAATKLKRSSQMGSLYRLLKGKVEGSSLDGKSSQGGRKSKVGASTGGKQGMADALAEMTKRSAYFIQIEEDVKNHAKAIMEIKTAISTFETKDMAELSKFHKHVESIMEKLTDESQVLARFEGFPGKKLESLRMAAALYSKLDAIVKTLENWKIEAPLGQLLDKAESYFNKIKGELDTLERIKDEESKKFQSHKITFDFGILVRIKELIVDVSSGCMELALKEKREAKEKENAQNGPKKKGSAKTLWKAFQFAFRVYTFAGGHDDRADKLTRELAQEIESDPHH